MQYFVLKTAKKLNKTAMKRANTETHNHYCSFVYPANPKLPVKAHTYAFKPVEKQISANASMVVASEITKCSIPIAKIHHQILPQ